MEDEAHPRGRGRRVSGTRGEATTGASHGTSDGAAATEQDDFRLASALAAGEDAGVVEDDERAAMRLVDWSCDRCTLLNAADDERCVAPAAVGGGLSRRNRG